jgi:MATE family multidrug resistance protein
LLGRQHARAALVLQAGINVVNVAVALFLVVERHWGIAGIATATLLAEWTGCLMGLAILLTNGVHPRLLRWSEIVDGPSLRRLLALNRDILLRTIAMVAAYGWFTRTGARAGEAILAANAVLLNFHMIYSYALDGFANAAEALVGEAIGARRIADYRSVLRASAASAFTVAALISLIYLAFGRQIIGVFTNQEAIRTVAGEYLPWLIVLPLVAVWSFLLDGVFVGATRAPELRDSMLISFAGFLVLAVGLGAWFGNHGLWCAMLGFMALRAITLGMRLPGIEKKSFTVTSDAVRA